MTPYGRRRGASNGLDAHAIYIVKASAQREESLASNASLAPLVEHFSRTILCEAVSVSRNVCHGAYEQLDLLGMLKDLQEAFEDAEADYAAQALEATRLENRAAELMNKFMALLHVLLCTMFRHGRPPHAYSKEPEEVKEKNNGGRDLASFQLA